MIVYNLVLLILFVNYSECNDYQQQQNHNYGIKGRTGHNIKSYGGYFHDTAGYNEAANNFVNTQNYYRPPIAPYQPYGWNFNQPARTYGGINTVSQTAASDQNPQSPSNNRIGWTNNNNYAGLNPNPLFPTLPQPNMFFPTFIPQFPFPQFPNVFPFQNNLPQPYPNYPTGPQVNTNNNQGPGSLPYPQNNFNPGFPTVNTNNAEQKPIHGFGRFPQTNVNQGIPEGNINRSPDPNNLGPNEVQTNLNQITTTERIQNKAGGPTTLRPTTSTIINTILAEGNSDEGVDYQFPLNPDFSKPTKAGGRTTTKPTTTTTINSIFGEDDSEETVDYQFTEKPNLPKNSSDVDIRTTGLNVRNNTSSDKDKGFASNSFFENNDQREWTDDDEQKWLATTKAPYFENKVPGLECTLPAAAVLGAKNAFKVSTLLPLDVPPGKPILSCNATDLLQSHVLLDGMTYGCNNNEITLSCLTHGGLIDECEGQTLQCDTDKLNVEKVWCTNGTLISSSDVECRNAFVEAHKSTLNCFFKHTRTSSIQTTARPSIVNVLPVVPLPTPDSSNIAGLDNRNEKDFDYENIEQQSEEPQDLMPQVKNAMKNVFPQDLLTMPSTGYLPPQSSMQPLNPNLRSLINSVFNTDMLASSLTGNEDDQVRSVANRNHYDFSNVRDQKNSGNDGTKTRQTSTVNRFGGDNNQQQRPNLQDRLIFTD